MGYVYKMLDKEGEILYIGITHNMYARMTGHFGKNRSASSVPIEDQECVHKIMYTEIKSYADVRVLEAYLIAKYKPRWNKEFVEEGELTFHLETGKLEWKEWELRKHDNPEHHILVWKDEELLYEIPKIEEVYTPLAEKLGLSTDMDMPYASAIMDNGYRLMRMSSKRHVRTGKGRQKPKYEFMGYGNWEVLKQASGQ